MKTVSQSDLFEQPAYGGPEGFLYKPELITPEQEQDLIGNFAALPFKQFEFQGYLGKRRVVSFGWRYDFNGGGLRKTEEIPDFLLALRNEAARFASIEADSLEHVLVTEYTPGAAIGWHKDRPDFEDVIGISVGSPCIFRFRRKTGSRWDRRSLRVEPTSAYLLRGPSRTEWEHSIPGVEELRYSVTFRTLKSGHTTRRSSGNEP